MCSKCIQLTGWPSLPSVPGIPLAPASPLIQKDKGDTRAVLLLFYGYTTSTVCRLSQLHTTIILLIRFITSLFCTVKTNRPLDQVPPEIHPFHLSQVDPKK